MSYVLVGQDDFVLKIMEDTGKYKPHRIVFTDVVALMFYIQHWERIGVEWRVE